MLTSHFITGLDHFQVSTTSDAPAPETIAELSRRFHWHCISIPISVDVTTRTLSVRQQVVRQWFYTYSNKNQVKYLFKCDGKKRGHPLPKCCGKKNVMPPSGWWVDRPPLQWNGPPPGVKRSA